MIIKYYYQAGVIDDEGRSEWLETLHDTAAAALSDGIRFLAADTTASLREVWLDRWTYVDGGAGVCVALFASNGRSAWALRRGGPR